MHVNAFQEVARHQPAAQGGQTKDEEISCFLLKLQEVPERLQKTKSLTVVVLIKHINIMSLHLEEAKTCIGPKRQDLLSRYNEMATRLREAAVGVLELIVGKELFARDVLEAALLPRENKKEGALISMVHKDTWQPFVTTDNIESLPQGLKLTRQCLL
jgi:hypothetical protein